MKLLLDTHIWLWSLLEPDRLTKKVAQALEDRANELWVSPFSTWEALILAQKGRVHLQPDPIKWLLEVFKSLPFREAPFNHQVAVQSRLMELLHQDPVDRFLAATALVFGLTLVTADERLLHAKKITLLANKK
jgi:PIN domain nuclease of toxin-antitoxin system